MSFKIFISYSTRDRTRTIQVKRLLERAGAKVFVAEYSFPAGAELTREIIATTQKRGRVENRIQHPVGQAYLLPPLSSGGAFIALP